MEIEKLIQKTMPLRLLYVEDDEILRVSTVGVFGNFFENIIVGTNGYEGIELFEKNGIDLIITDISMPKMDGIEMIKNIRKKDESVPIIVISAYNEQHIIDDAKQHKISGYIFKPIDLAQMCAQIEEAIQ
jgi:YesN/AraC family two-component response regulator